MKKTLTTALIMGLMAGCSHSPQQANTVAPAKSDKLSAKDHQKAKQDKRGHAARAMNQERLNSLLEKYNGNDDQQLSWDEFEQKRRAQFDRSDSNKNDSVDAEEYVYEFEGRLDDRYEAARKGQVKQTIVRFNALDKNDDQLISWAEYQQSGERTFAWWDSNKDGGIDAKDPKPVYKKKMAKAKSAAVAKAKAKGNYKSKKKKHSRSIINMPTTHSKKGMFTIYDANQDETISKGEFNSERRSLFHIADQDKNGQLNQSEYLGEYEDRLDTAIAKSRRAAIKQTYVRFNILDDDKNKAMTFAEFQLSGKRIFSRWDKNKDGIISSTDIGI